MALPVIAKQPAHGGTGRATGSATWCTTHVCWTVSTTVLSDPFTFREFILLSDPSVVFTLGKCAHMYWPS
jgi:hypothetical protein